MILTISDAGRASQWRVKVQFDFGAKLWRLEGQPAPLAWNRIASATQGPLQLRGDGKVAYLWEKVGDTKKRNPLIVWDPPLNSQDTIRKAGGGLLFEPKDPSLKDARIQWASSGSSGSIREDALALIKKNLPSTLGTYVDPVNWVEKAKRGENTAKNSQGFRATGCGGLPGKMFEELQNMGWPIPNDRVDGHQQRYTGIAYPTKNPKDPNSPKVEPLWMTLTGRTIGYKFIVEDGVEKRLNMPGKIYIKYTKGDTRRPKPGDVYVLYTPGGSMFRHVGVIVNTTTDAWITADGGQDGPEKSGFAIGLTERPFDSKSGQLRGLGEAGLLNGWIDIEMLVAGGRKGG